MTISGTCHAIRAPRVGATVGAPTKGVRSAFDAAVPAKAATHLLLGTWNIRAFGDLTPKWRTEPGDSPKRNLADLMAIAEIVSRFDVCAIQETRGT